MAKKEISTYKYPSRFGSHTSMIVRQEGDSFVLEDEFGEYTTERFYLENNCADPHRTAQRRLTKLFGGGKNNND
jgi:hypothetical protein